MSASDSRQLIFARSVGTVGLGVATGLMLSIPLWIQPSLEAAPISSKDRLHLWSKVYDQGKATALTIFPVCSVLFATSAWRAESPALYLPANFVARNRKTILALCSSLSASVIGYTAAFLMPGIKRLKGAESDFVTGQKPSFSTNEEIKKWGKLHLLRTAFAATGFVLGVAELVSS
ncbi:DUF1772 domain-containing protein [Sporobolomyces salmoneus]|uniref:DUF1772 domain-containing protein n=1 Tax=Sporobolomyces salmoneus TaxID=183962 RepID=UPI00317E73BC